VFKPEHSLFLDAVEFFGRVKLHNDRDTSQHLFEVTEVALKYLSLIMIATSGRSGSGVLGLPARERNSLQRPSLGTWQTICFRLVDLCETAESILKPQTQSLKPGLTRRAKQASKEIVRMRNEIAHGTAPSEGAAQRFYEEAQKELELVLAWMDPLTQCLLVKPEPAERRGGVSRFPARVLEGSHPSFGFREFSTAMEVDTDCSLYEPQTGVFASLYPWIQFDHCPACGHESVALYDSLQGRTVFYREPGRGHRQESRDATQRITERLGAENRYTE
jgi:hypothetical protein